MKILGIIPARYASTRFPAKALAMIGGKTMIQRVYEQAIQSAALSTVVVATDHSLILNAVENFGGKAVMTSEQHPSGTDRCFEVYTKLATDYDFVVNIQGDEPFIQPAQIDLLCSILQPTTELATLVKKIEEVETLKNINSPKVIFNTKMEAIYFSRHPIPFVRGKDVDFWLSVHMYYKHIGIYSYRSDVLKSITQIPASSLELAEALEQLRWLENGYKIQVAITPFDSHGIDTPEDLQAAIKKFL